MSHFAKYHRRSVKFFVKVQLV